MRACRHRGSNRCSGFGNGVLLTGEAQAACTPAAAANNVTATFSGTTTNPGGGAPGAGADGYGTGVTTGITVNATAGAGNTVTGNHIGVYVGAGTVTITPAPASRAMLPELLPLPAPLLSPARAALPARRSTASLPIPTRR